MAKAPHYDGLTAEIPFGEAAEIVFRALLDEISSSAPAVLHGDDTRAVHDMRVSIRRLRSAIETFGDALSAKRRKRSRVAMRRIGRKLGPVRDCDVLLAVLRAALAGAANADRAGIVHAIETLVARRRSSLATFAIEFSQFDRRVIVGTIDA